LDPSKSPATADTDIMHMNIMIDPLIFILFMVVSFC
jgi:hypothetical protein